MAWEKVGELIQVRYASCVEKDGSRNGMGGGGFYLTIVT